LKRNIHESLRIDNLRKKLLRKRMRDVSERFLHLLNWNSMASTNIIPKGAMGLELIAESRSIVPGSGVIRCPETQRHCKKLDFTLKGWLTGAKIFVIRLQD
jgi:hypothetical protein